MRKIIVLNLLALFVASSAFAAASQKMNFDDAGKTLHGAASGVDATSPTISKLSTGVAIGWNASTTGYAINTQHRNGVKAFGTSADSTSLYVIDATKNNATDAPTSTGSDSFDSWKTL